MERLIKSEIERVQSKQVEICKKYAEVLNSDLQNNDRFLEETRRSIANIENHADKNIIAKIDVVTLKLDALEKALEDVKNAANELSETIDAACPSVVLGE